VTLYDNTAAVENSNTTRQFFLHYQSEFGSVQVLDFLVALLASTATYCMTSFIVYLFEHARNVGLAR